MIEQFLKFCVVGGSGVLVDFGVTYLAKERLRINKYMANAMGFLVAASTNYMLNRWWTFHSTSSDITMQYLKFMGVSLVGLAINSAVIYLLHGRAKQNFYLSKIAAIGVATIWNFFINMFYTF